MYNFFGLLEVIISKKCKVMKKNSTTLKTTIYCTNVKNALLSLSKLKVILAKYNLFKKNYMFCSDRFRNSIQYF